MKDLHRQIRDLEDYITELEAKKSGVDADLLKDEKNRSRDLVCAGVAWCCACLGYLVLN